MTPKAKAGWTRLDWDSDHFGVAIGRLDDSDISLPDLQVRIETARRAGIRCLYWLTTQETASAVRGSPSMKVLDRRLVYRRPVAFGSSQLGTRHTARVRAAEKDDLVTLKELAFASHLQTRFHEDTSFSELRARKLYSRWIEKALSEPDQTVLVCGSRGRPIGYVTCSPQDESTTVIGLLAVAPEHQGMGLGHSLVNAAVEWAADRHHDSIEVVTQGRNSGARTLYERNRFALASDATWIHIWLSADATDIRPDVGQ